ncbi:MAG: enoyl-CoA hydratase/isomerase family protein [Bdellovibrionales bacterium]|nr:enoyl-CoA hydratase/isomerase family protein [Bdellovibrionales bacterium]
MSDMGLKIVDRGEIAWVEWDMPGEKVNKLSTPVMVRLETLLGELKASKYKLAVFISKKPKIFIAGADIEEIKGLKKRDEAAAAAAQGQRIFNLIEDLPIPVIAAINGAALGGGCEFSIACDYRVCSDDPSTKIGLPEVQLGVIPGFGGCVRLPRLIGIQGALDIILAGKSVDGKKAEKLGLVDKCCPLPILESEVMKLASEVVAGGAKKRRKTFVPKGAMAVLLEGPLKRVVFSKAKQAVMKQSRGNYPAPLRALDVVQKTYGMSDRSRALQIEHESFGDVAVTEVSKNLIHIFFMTEAIKKQSGVSDASVKPRTIKSMAVLGAGTMGGGIAQLGADKGIDVRLKDINHEAIGRGLQHAYDIWKKKVDRKQLTRFQMKQKMDKISAGTDWQGFKHQDLVIEAIVEDMNIKKKVIGECAAECKPGAIIATNTSSLSVTEMSAGHPHPENFVGMHFFNPVDKMPLIEVIRGEKTSDEVTATIFDLSKKMGKMPVVVKDGPGFLVNRLLLPYLNEAIYLLSEGMAVEELDEIFLDFGMPMGPLHLIDEIGIDVAIKVAKIFHKAFGERAEPSPLMFKTGESGRLGKKNKRGFYLYDDRGKKLAVDPTIYQALGLPAPSKGKISKDDCIHRGMFAMINEASLAFLTDKIVNRADEVDLAMIMGTGFPPFRGGLLKYADNLGADIINERLTHFAKSGAKRFIPSEPLKRLAEQKRTFY